MADTAVDTTVNADQNQRMGIWGPYWLDADIGALVVIDGAGELLVYRTTDGGANWSPTTICSRATYQVAAFFDQEVPGDTGTLLHLFYNAPDTTLGRGCYRTFDLSDASLGTERNVTGDAGAAGGSNHKIAGCKTRNGNLILAAFFQTAASPLATYKSTDSGASWSAIADGFENGANDGAYLFPANTGDGADAAMIYYDDSAAQLSVKMYDDSANTWTETTILSSVDPGSLDATYDLCHIDAALRHSNGIIYGAIWNLVDNATADLLTFTVNPNSIASPTVAATTNVLTDTAESGGAAVAIDQVTGDVYVAYLIGGTFQSLVHIAFKKSTDGMSTWGSQQAYSETQDDYRRVSGPRTIGADGGRIQWAWFDDDDNDLFINLVNDLVLNAGSPQTITPSGVASLEAFGTDQLNLALTATGVASAEAFGSHLVQRLLEFIAPSGIASLEAFGSVTLQLGAVTITPSGITTAEAFGSQTLAVGATTIATSGVASEEAFGTSIVTGAIRPAGIPSEESFTNTRENVLPNGGFEIDLSLWSNNAGFSRVTTEAKFGTASAWTDSTTSYRFLRYDQAWEAGQVWHVSAWRKGNGLTLGNPAGLSIEAGSATISVSYIESTRYHAGTFDWERVVARVTVTGSGTSRVIIAKGYGTGGDGEVWFDGVMITQAIDTNPIDYIDTNDGPVSIESFAVVTGPISVSGIASEEAFGSPLVQRMLEFVIPSGIASAEAFGSHSLTLGAVSISPAGVTSAEAFGTSKVNLSVVTTGISSAEAFGSSTLTTGPVTVAPSGIASAEAFGTANVAKTIAPSGIASAEAFGSATLVPGAVTVLPSGIASAEAFGSHLVNLEQFISPSGVVSAEAFGSHIISVLDRRIRREPGGLDVVFLDAAGNRLGSGPVPVGIRASTREAVDRIGSWTLTIPATEGHIANIVDDALEVDIYDGSTRVFSGIVSDWDLADIGDQRFYEISGESLGQEILWATTHPGVIATDQTAEAAMDLLLAQVESVWSSTVTGSGFQNLSTRFNEPSVWKSLTELALTQQAHIRETDTRRELEIFRGHTSTGIVLSRPDIMPLDRANPSEWMGLIEGIPSFKRDRRQIINRIIPEGLDAGNIVFDLGKSDRASPWTRQSFIKNRPSIVHSVSGVAQLNVPADSEVSEVIAEELVVSGNNRVILVIIAMDRMTGGGNLSVEAAGQRTPGQWVSEDTPTSGDHVVWSFPIFNPTAGTTDITVIASNGGASAETINVNVFALSIQDAQQPFARNTNEATNQASSSAGSVTLASIADDLRIGAMTSTTAFTATSGASQTRLYTNVGSAPDLVVDMMDQTSGGDADSTFNWTLGASESWGAIAVTIKGVSTWYIEDAASVTQWRRRIHYMPINARQFVGGTAAQLLAAANTLYDYSTTILNRYNDEAKFYKVNVTNLPDVQWLVGDTMQLVWSGSVLNMDTGQYIYVDIDDEVEVVERVRKWDADGVKTWQLTLADCCRLPVTDAQLLSSMMGRLEAVESAI